MSKSKPASRVRISYDFIRAQSTTFPVQVLCRVLGVAPSGYYAWLKKPHSNRALEDARLIPFIRASFLASQGIYGAPRVFLDLREAEELIKRQIYNSREFAKAAIRDHIEKFYNRSRRHSHLGGVSPEQFEAAHKCRNQGVH